MGYNAPGSVYFDMARVCQELISSFVEEYSLGMHDPGWSLPPEPTFVAPPAEIPKPQLHKRVKLSVTPGSMSEFDSPAPPHSVGRPKKSHASSPHTPVSPSLGLQLIVTPEPPIRASSSTPSRNSGRFWPDKAAMQAAQDIIDHLSRFAYSSMYLCCVHTQTNFYLPDTVGWMLIASFCPLLICPSPLTISQSFHDLWISRHFEGIWHPRIPLWTTLRCVFVSESSYVFFRNSSLSVA